MSFAKISLAAFLALAACVSAPKRPLPGGYCSSTSADILNMIPARNLREACEASRISHDDGLPYELCLSYQLSCDEEFDF